MSRSACILVDRPLLFLAGLQSTNHPKDQRFAFTNGDFTVVAQFRFHLSMALIFSIAISCGADEQREIRSAVVRDSAMMRSDFEKLANADVPPKPSDFHDKSLTWAILSFRVTQEPKEGFQFAGNSAPKPSDLGAEIYRIHKTGLRKILTSPATVIHDDRITSLKYEIENDVATGKVGFAVPNLYSGLVEFVAHRHKSGWMMTEFSMPDFAITLGRGEDGAWKVRQDDGQRLSDNVGKVEQHPE